jgi:predicted nucleic acid-binding protein
MRRIELVDACVLIPANVRDTLLRLAAARFFDIRWSAQILGEVRQALAGKPWFLVPSQIDSLLEQIRKAFGDADVFDYEEQLGLATNHPKDQHVLAAAIAGEAHSIVTFNVRHFPPESCSSFGITVHTPDDLFCQCLKEDPDLVNQLLIEQVVALRNPEISQADVLSGLYRQVPKFVEALVTDFGAPELQRLMAVLPPREEGSQHASQAGREQQPEQLADPP